MLERNQKTRIKITGSYIDAGGNSKEVTVDITLYNEGFPARLKNATLGYKKSDIWTDPLNLGSYSSLDLGNGTYRYRFTDDIPGSGVSVFTQIYDRREIFVQAEVILSEG